MEDIGLKRIINEIKNRGLTAYEISKDLPISEVGINKILNGQSKNPRRSTLILLRNYLFKEKEGTVENKAQKEPSNERFEDIVARKVSENNRLQLINIGAYHKSVLNELAKQAVRMEQIQIQLEEMEERILKESKEIKSIIK